MTAQQKLALIIAILASSVSFLDGTVVNVALPAMVGELGGGLPVQQWIVNAYLITLGAFILLAGSLSDLFGRKKILSVGLIGFGVASVLCAIAPTPLFLIIARALQGLAGALLVPSSLAIIIAAFSGKVQAKAIGSWTAWTSVCMVLGPLLGGVLTDAWSWRLVFAINIPFIAATLWLLTRLDVPLPVRRTTRVDSLGAVLCTGGLAAAVYGLIEQPARGWDDPLVVLSLLAGMLMLGWFIRHERRTIAPMVPISLFKVRNFTAGNLATVAIYAGLSVATFLIVLFVQQVAGYSAVAAGLVMLPTSIALIALSSRFGALAGTYGPRLFMTLGPIIGGLGFLLFTRTTASASYWSELFPAIALFSLGLAMTVAPLTAAVLGDIKGEQAGIGSAINNAVARIAGLIAVASIGLVVGDQLTLDGFHRGALCMAILLVLGGIISWTGIRNRPVPDASKVA